MYDFILHEKTDLFFFYCLLLCQQQDVNIIKNEKRRISLVHFSRSLMSDTK